MTLETATYEEKRAAIDAAHHHDPTIVYLGHHYGRDDWHGTGTPYTTLAAALRHEADPDEWENWIDAADTPPGKRMSLEHGHEWWPTMYDGEEFEPGEDDNHPYIQKAELKS